MRAKHITADIDSSHHSARTEDPRGNTLTEARLGQSWPLRTSSRCSLTPAIPRWDLLIHKGTAGFSCGKVPLPLIKPVSPKGNQSWIFTGRTDAEAEAPTLWPPDAKNWLTGKDPDPGRDWRQEKGMTEDEMVGWHNQLNGHEFEQALGDGDGQRILTCCSPWGHKKSDTSEWLKGAEPLLLPRLLSLLNGRTWEKNGRRWSLKAWVKTSAQASKVQICSWNFFFFCQFNDFKQIIT